MCVLFRIATVLVLIYTLERKVIRIYYWLVLSKLCGLPDWDVLILASSSMHTLEYAYYFMLKDTI